VGHIIVCRLLADLDKAETFGDGKRSSLLVQSGHNSVKLFKRYAAALKFPRERKKKKSACEVFHSGKVRRPLHTAKEIRHKILNKSDEEGFSKRKRRIFVCLISGCDAVLCLSVFKKSPFSIFGIFEKKSAASHFWRIFRNYHSPNVCRNFSELMSTVFCLV
jgi:hypothetical protein